MMEKPKTFNGDLNNLPPALQPLTDEERWVIWSWQWRSNKGGGKWTKPPRQARDPGRNARSNDPSTWGSYNDAVIAVAAGKADGIGYTLLGSRIGAIDIDHCREPDGTVARWAEDLSNEANGAYREITVSGGGLRIIGTGNDDKIQRKFTFDRKTGAGIELYRNTERYITISGLEVSECASLPPLDSLIDKLLTRHGNGQTQQSNGGLDFNDASPQQSSSIDYDDLIRNGAPEGERSEWFQAVVWHLAGKGWSAEQIADELGRHPNGIGVKYAGRLRPEVMRSYDKWRASKHAAAIGNSGAPAGSWPEIHVIAGELPRVVNEAEDALLGLGREIFQRGSMIVRPIMSKLPASDNRETESWRLILITRPYLVETLTRAARFMRFDARVKAFVPTDAPDRVADTYLSRTGAWRLPELGGITNAPFLRRDGSLCEQSGHDPASGLLFKPGDENFPAVPQQPSKADAIEALALLNRLIDSFPFVSPADRSVALSAILTTLDRRSMTTAPLHAFTAPTAGTGKSLLVDVVASIATGRLMPVIAQGRTEEELEKRLGAALLAGDTAISLDNCDYPLQGVFLCQALTQQQLNIRVLGLSKIVETPVNATIFATGNNLTIAGDLTRRALICSLDAHCERPELRRFDSNVIDMTRNERRRLVVAALTLLRAWHIAGERVDVVPFGSFDDWSYRVREPLIWLGRADPCDTVAEMREDDPKRAALLTIVLQWKEALGNASSYTMREIINVAVNRPDFYNALVTVAAAGRASNLLSNERLGRWLKANEKKVAGGFSIVRTGAKDGYPLWRLGSA
jgi:hypothetical protein